MPRTIVFDVNETLLDLAALDAPFAEVFGDASVRALWFAQVLQSALVGNSIGKYSNFGVIGAAALEMVAQRNDSPQPQERLAFGLLTLNPPPINLSS